jgi:hypothetical protein
MEAWRTYTPDGRMLEVEYAGGEWVARCAGVRGVGTSALEAITAAVGGEPESIARSHPALESWVIEHAEQLESEAG